MIVRTKKVKAKLIQKTPLTRTREWGPELRAREGGAESTLPPANPAPMKVRITNFFMEGRLAKDLYRVQFW